MQDEVERLKDYPESEQVFSLVFDTDVQEVVAEVGDDAADDLENQEDDDTSGTLSRSVHDHEAAEDQAEELRHSEERGIILDPGSQIEKEAALRYGHS